MTHRTRVIVSRAPESTGWPFCYEVVNQYGSVLSDFYFDVDELDEARITLENSCPGLPVTFAEDVPDAIKKALKPQD